MSTSDPSFDAIESGIRGLWTADARADVKIEAAVGMLLLQLPTDVAAFTVFNGDPDEEFKKAYGSFKRLYRENSRTWDELTLSFVACRSSEDQKDDRFYAALEADPLFCRKYVIRAYDTASAQREELRKLPFLPLAPDGGDGVQRPQPAQDLLQSVGVSSSFARNLVEPGKRAAERIAQDLRDGHESLPAALTRPDGARLSVTAPRAASRLASLTVEGFRVYRDAQTFDLDASVIVLYGPNGLGKTSLYDAIEYACTGRIGRLCKVRRSQSEFARIASHLDKTPGSGSVVLTLKGHGGNNSRGRRIQRGTGDWGTAWIDGEEFGRKDVINTITQAGWLDTVPRLPNLESLFRATHLFSQGEQELLGQFQDGSTIPEAFVSETLSLQDYSAGLDKVGKVLSELRKYERVIEQDVRRLREKAHALKTALTEASEPGIREPTAIDFAIADLRQEMGSAPVDLEPLPETATVDAYAEWHELAMTRSVSCDDRVRLAQTLRNELSGHQEQVRAQAEAQTRLEDIAQEFSEVADQERAVARRLEVAGASLKDAETKQKRIEHRLKDLRAASNALSELGGLARQMAALAVERDRHNLERVDVDSRATEGKSALSKAAANLSEARRRVQSKQSEVAEIRGLLEELPQREEDESLEAKIQGRIVVAQEAARDARTRREQAKKNLHLAQRARELREPEYRRATAAQTEIETLLDSIHRHVRDDSCPLCGSEFETVDKLQASIRRRREGESPYSDLTTDYRKLVEAESQATDRLQVGAAEVTRAEQAVEELQGTLQSTNLRLQSFDGRVERALSQGHPDVGQLRGVLERRQEAISEELRAGEAVAETARIHLTSLEFSVAEDTARRETIQEQLGELEGAIQKLADSRRALSAQVEATLPDAENSESGLAEAAAVAERTRDDLIVLIRRLQTEQQASRDEAEALSKRRQALSAARSQLVATLGQLNQSTSSFRQRLGDLGASDDGDSLDGVIDEETGRSEAIRALAAKGRIVVEALRARALRQRLLEARDQLERVGEESGTCEERLTRVRAAAAVCKSMEGVLKRERETAIERHIAAYGPLITRIQQRLRAVYGFGEVQLEAHGGEARVRVEWRNKSVQVPPSDFFSDSQKQILMLSIFMAGGLRQNWSGFAPVLLDDPVTHFDDLNSYAFVELIRGMVATAPHRWQFVVSTCEHRLFDLMQRKFSRLASGAIFYEHRVRYSMSFSA